MPAPKRNTSKRKTSAPDPAPSRARTGKAAEHAPNRGRSPRRREIGAFICLLLGVFAALAYFNNDAWLIRGIRTGMSGLFGWGFYAIPLALFAIAAILAFHRGRPVILRVTATALIPALIGA
ncbi:MAG: DNA translocase FtsK, partial [Oscillospiraceae bacterium]|nr:DNA translocase FtsK [Oscillospiraceae bacterium]